MPSCVNGLDCDMTTPEKPPIGAPCNGCGVCCRATVCSCGSLLLRLVSTPGERAPGPCPALLPDGDGWGCGLMLRPTDYLKSTRGPTVLRKAVAVLIASGTGCDDAGDEPDETAMPNLRMMQARYLADHSSEEVNKAWRTLIS